MNFHGDDVLEKATLALRESPVAEMPPDAVARAQSIPAAKRIGRRWNFYLKPLAACAALLAIAAILVSTRASAPTAFADVAKAIGQTQTFTGKVDLTMPESTGAAPGMHFKVDVSVKGSSIRADSIGFTIIGDQTHKKMLVLIPLLHQAMTEDLSPQAKVFDIYSLMRDYHTGNEKSLGEKNINGHKALGFQLVRPADASGGISEDWTFWVDPQTKLPVQIEFLGPGIEAPIVMTDLRFDVQLNDSIFETKVPAGYTSMNADKSKSDPSDRRKYSGQVFDERGNPIEGVEVQAKARDASSSSSWNSGDAIRTDREGKFSMDLGEPVESIGIGLDLKAARADSDRYASMGLEFKHPGFLFGNIEGLQLMSPEQRTSLHIRLRDGKTLAGRVVDGADHPVAGAMVEAVFGKASEGKAIDELRRNYDRRVLTDAAGKFELRGLAANAMVVQIRRTDPALPLLWGQAKVNLFHKGMPEPVEIVARPIELPPDKKVHTLLGMKLVDVDDDLRDRLSLWPFETILILDPGPNAVRLGLGNAQQGDCLWHAQNDRLKDFNDFTAHVLSACQSQKTAGWENFSVNVTYSIPRPGERKNGDGRLRLTGDDLAELEKSTKP